MIIFGGTGFIGKHLCVKLDEQGAGNVTVVSPNPDSEFLARFAPSVKSMPLSEFQDAPERLLADCRTVVYLAGNSIPSTFSDQPWKEYSANVEPAFRLFDQCLSCNPGARVIFISSGGTVYGRGHRQPIPEHAALKPISPYGLGKVAIEEALRFLGRTRKLQFDILRVSNPVGKWQTNPSQGVVNVMLRAALSGTTIKLFGDGLYVRDFLDADDVATAIINVALRDNATNDVFNIGSGIGTSIADVFHAIEIAFSTTIQREMLPARDLDLEYSVLDASKAARELNWRAGHDFGAILRKLATEWQDVAFRKGS